MRFFPPLMTVGHNNPLCFSFTVVGFLSAAALQDSQAPNCTGIYFFFPTTNKPLQDCLIYLNNVIAALHLKGKYIPWCGDLQSLPPYLRFDLRLTDNLRPRPGVGAHSG